MEAQSDFKELLALFNAHQVEYMIVGAGSATPKTFLPSFRAKGEMTTGENWSPAFVGMTGQKPRRPQNGHLASICNSPNPPAILPPHEY